MTWKLRPEDVALAVTTVNYTRTYEGAETATIVLERGAESIPADQCPVKVRGALIEWLDKDTPDYDTAMRVFAWAFVLLLIALGLIGVVAIGRAVL